MSPRSSPGEGLPTAEAAALHLENFSVYAAREAGILSFERLWKWRADGLLAGWDLSPGFYAKFAKAAARAGETERARAIFEEAIDRFPRFGGIFRADPGLRRVPPEAGGDRGGRRASGKASGGRPAGVPVGGPLPSRPGGMEGGAPRGGAQSVP